MEKNIVRKGILAAAILIWIFGAGSAAFCAAGPEKDKPAEKSAVQPPVAARTLEPAAMPEGQNVEKLLYTLNETLQENRKIREGMRNLQEAFEKTTLEKSDLVNQMKKVEQLAIQRSKDASQKIDDLNAQLNNSKKEMEKLQGESTASIGQKLEVEKKLEAIDAENVKMRELLNSSILTPERDRIVERMRQNDEAVQSAVAQISSMDGENVALKSQLVQAYFNLGNMFYDLGRFEDAAVQYLHVLEWDPYHAWSHHNLAVIYDYHLHKNSLAIDHYRKYLRLRLPSEEGREARIRLWDLQQLSKLAPDQPLKQDFDKFQKMPRS